MDKLINKIKKKMSRDDGFALAVVYLLFLFLILSLTGLSYNIQNNAKYTDMTVSNDVAYYFSYYGVQQAQDRIFTFVTNQPDSRREEYVSLGGTEKLISDLRTQVPAYFGSEPSSKNLMSLDAKICKQRDNADGTKPSDPYILVVESEVEDRSRGQATTTSILGTRMSPLTRQDDHTSSAAEKARLFGIVFSNIVEVKKDYADEYLQCP